ncbi:hypothetical protein ABIB82_007843 [Bradyrhizobium sp. i1.8.4]|uniref:hypothetical protein n=1 Tax=unclassified Bradyrhizobium TaxID=2631580 RepID=UPI003D22DA88
MQLKTCNGDMEHIDKGQATEPRIGFSLYTTQARPGRAVRDPNNPLTTKCGIDTDPSLDEECQRIRIEMFVPVVQPQPFCLKKTFADFWLNRLGFDWSHRMSPSVVLCSRDIKRDVKSGITYATKDAHWRPEAVVDRLWCN